MNIEALKNNIANLEDLISDHNKLGEALRLFGNGVYLDYDGHNKSMTLSGASGRKLLEVMIESIEASIKELCAEIGVDSGEFITKVNP